MSRQIAPTLTWHIQDPFASDPAAFREAIPEMVRELRALLAVARAAQGLVEAEGRDGPEAVRLARALARLSPSKAKRCGRRGRE
jgi:hypothetical protein